MCTAAYKWTDARFQEHVRLGKRRFSGEMVSKDKGRSDDVFSKLLER